MCTSGGYLVHEELLTSSKYSGVGSRRKTLKIMCSLIHSPTVCVVVLVVRSPATGPTTVWRLHAMIRMSW